MKRVTSTNNIELENRLVAINRVSKVTKGGRTFSLAAIVVVGDGKGVIGYGLGRSNDTSTAITKGTDAAKKNLIQVPVFKGTIPHEVSARFAGAEVLLRPASEGTGVVAGGAMRAVLDMVGVTDVLCKSNGSSNAHNVVKATILALSKLSSPLDIARTRGISVEKVFKG
ncbi:30S ribosomal protein S5 [uncultured Porphyromonas sp.]|uniref:30S ribosomal protein S5 n=1 Tax=uncultured Porphyromonas sp. TaxID=159274 RepID=UPI0025DD863D|nr:30S ribosomal protein S5 [uncultured Porphyromonas sp.]